MESASIRGLHDIATGNSILFAPRLSEEYAVWLGEIKPLTYFKGIEKFEKDLGTLHPILTECRVLKTDTELAVIQFANDISSEAHVESRPDLPCLNASIRSRRSMPRFSFQIWTAAGSVVGGLHRRVEVSRGRDVVSGSGGGGENSSVLHYGHAAAPNERTLQDGDMALLDMGAEFNFYGSDITCSFPAVLNAHNAVISSMKPGCGEQTSCQCSCASEFLLALYLLFTSRLAEKTVLEALKQGGLLVGDVDNMMIERLGAVFMPHGLGHFLGIDTHDPGGYLKGAERPKEPGLRAIRTSRELLEGMVITVEPGCYFIDVLLVPAMESSRTSKFLKSEEISKFRGFGGVRIESDVYVTSNGCVNMTKCPREVHDIEAVMAGAPWPIKKTSIHFEARES
ncbi:hypothetical protein RJ639_018538 [Escallonia herrerae]|uniref:Peptidase M24 domain-containing protein n=1 Tax=Escallonia herrerae TaxID=1293975 RepID=A0AA89AJI3_9ASTE|nr:hypothetical protein RJ639_018538 [Escallonia herrerae]